MIVAKTYMDKTPEGCAFCDLSDGDCKCLVMNKYNLGDNRPSWCPLMEIEGTKENDNYYGVKTTLLNKESDND